MNLIDALSVTLSLLALLVSIFGYAYRHNGQYAFDAAVRKRMIKRRAVQMGIYSVWSIALFALSMIENREINVMIYLSLSGSLVFFSTYQISGWMDYQDIVGNRSIHDK